MKKKLNVGILLFNGVETLDFAGPFEVFSVASELYDFSLFNVFTLAEVQTPITIVNGLSVNPNYSFINSPNIDILIIPGGEGTRTQLSNKTLLNWIKKSYQNSILTLSICSGSTLIGALGLLKNSPYCTHKAVFDQMKVIVPNGLPCPKERFVQSSKKIFTSSGISAGIDLSFHIVELLYDHSVAEQTAYYMEYDWKSTHN